MEGVHCLQEYGWEQAGQPLRGPCPFIYFPIFPDIIYFLDHHAWLLLNGVARSAIFWPVLSICRCESYIALRLDLVHCKNDLCELLACILACPLSMQPYLFFLFIYSFTQSSIHAPSVQPSIHPLSVCSFVCSSSLIHAFVHPSMQPSIHPSINCLFIYRLFIYFFTCFFVISFILLSFKSPLQCSSFSHTCRCLACQ